MKKTLLTTAFLVITALCFGQYGVQEKPQYQSIWGQSGYSQLNVFGVQQNMFKNQNSSGVNIYQFNEFGVKKKTHTLENNYIGGLNIYKFSESGLKKKVGTIEDNFMGGFNIYKYNKWGVKEKTGTVENKFW